MTMKEQFRALDSSALPQMAALYKNAFGGEPWNDDWNDTEQLMEYMKEISCSYNALNYGLFLDDKLIAMSVGMIRHWWEGTNYNIEEFCVSPDYQGSGTGSRFMAMIEEDIKKKDIFGIFLQTDNDKPSYRFYQKNGFGELCSHVSFYKKLK
ncbi:GNAT family N-acetyltransferase [Ruminococcus sp. XPD3002]|uniref:GNAT family N-acetyltransferase n=1 Tax=Ruminococcus sp. XPD3002 TaxID=1452269 RepID=UPI00090F4CBC|nr:Acetyltransferase (GNAT) family protein [Ruminococcus flavefaciens]